MTLNMMPPNILSALHLQIKTTSIFGVKKSTAKVSFLIIENHRANEPFNRNNPTNTPCTCTRCGK